MLRVTRLAVLLASAVTPAALAQHTHVPRAQHLDPQPRRVRLRPWPRGKKRYPHHPHRYRQVAEVVRHLRRRDGKTWKYSWSGPADGAIHPVNGMAGVSYGVTTATDTSVETYPDGTIQTRKFSLSADKKKFTDVCIAEPCV